MNKTSIEWCDYSVNPVRFRPHGAEDQVTDFGFADVVLCLVVAAVAWKLIERKDRR